MKIERDAFDEWMAAPVTEALMAGLLKAEKQAIEHWVQTTIEGGACDPVRLACIRERISVYREIRKLTAETLEELTS